MELRWRVDAEGTLHLSWAERDGPPVGVPERRSFGTQVIERSGPDQLGGTADIRWAPEDSYASSRSGEPMWCCCGSPWWSARSPEPRRFAG